MSGNPSANVDSAVNAQAGIPVQVSYAEPLRHVSQSRLAIRRYTRQVAVADILCVATSCLGGSALRFPGQQPSHIILLHIPVIMTIWLTVLATRSAYAASGLHSIRAQQRVIASAALITYPFVSMFSYTFKNYLSRGFLIFTMVLGLMLMTIVRTLLWHGFKKSNGFALSAQRTLVIGPPDVSDTQYAADLKPIAVLASPESEGFDTWLQEVVAAVKRDNIDVVLLSSDHALNQSRLQRLAWALEGGVDLVKQVAIGSLGRRAFLRVESGQAYLHLIEIGLTGPKRIIKRGFDVAVATVALIVLSPVYLLTAIAVKLSSPGPVFFVQPRVGQYGLLFPFPKFRSMRVGAHEDRAVTLGTPDEDMINRYRNDPRITGIGKVIRRLSIDELPQVWSVLRGHMSIVGPRPVLEEELALLASGDHRRHAAKPGLTGLWQVSGRKEVPWDQRMAMDVEYLETWSLGKDLALIARTVVSVLSGRGAV